jgi:2-succinyl-6-hydroxy-2,4-cyclohexadiene-1-carboxylate synthase
MTVPFGDGLRARVSPGDGDPVLWFHGYTMDSRVWSTLWELLPGPHHIGIDLPGHGTSRPLRTGEDLDTLAETIGAVAVESGVRRLVAMSFGTILALQVAIRRPDAFDTLVLAAPGLAGGPTDPLVEMRYATLTLIHSRFGPGPHMTRSWMRTPPDLFAGVNRRPRLKAAIAAIIDDHRWTELGDGAMTGLTAACQDERALSRITAATHVVLGSAELPAFRRCAGVIRDAVPGATVSEVPDAGHLVLLEKPARVAPIIGRALRS